MREMSNIVASPYAAAEPARVAVIEDERELREGLRVLIDFTAGFC